MPQKRDVFEDDGIVEEMRKPRIFDETEIPWVEKYRPKKLDDVIQQDEVVKVLKNTLVTGELPHLLFFGPPGTGKTSTILFLAKQIYENNYDDYVLELNASDDRGLSIINNTIYPFCKKKVNIL